MSTRIGIVGCGFVGRIHAWSLWALRDAGLTQARVTAVHDPCGERAQELASIHDAGVTGLEELLDDVDAVYVCTPTATHRSLVAAAVERGRAVFCEKPLGPTHTDSVAIADDLARVPHQVGLVLRHAPVFRRLVDILGESRHGGVMSIVFRDDQFFPNQGQYGSRWREDVAVAGGGTLIEHSIHDLDLLCWFAGEPAGVSCRTASFAEHPGIEDVANVTIVHRSGATSSLTSVWHQILSRPSTRRLEVFCEQALLWTDDDNTGPLHVETSDGEQVVECPPPAWVDELGVPEEVRRPLGLYAAADKAFCDRLVDPGAEAAVGADTALAAHVLVDAAYRSALQDGRPVELG